MHKMEIIKQEFAEKTIDGDWECIKLMVNKDFYIQIGYRGEDALGKARQTAEEIRLGLVQAITAKFHESRK